MVNRCFLYCLLYRFCRKTPLLEGRWFLVRSRVGLWRWYFWEWVFWVYSRTVYFVRSSSLIYRSWFSCCRDRWLVHWRCSENFIFLLILWGVSISRRRDCHRSMYSCLLFGLGYWSWMQGQNLEGCSFTRREVRRKFVGLGCSFERTVQNLWWYRLKRGLEKWYCLWWTV